MGIRYGICILEDLVMMEAHLSFKLQMEAM